MKLHIVTTDEFQTKLNFPLESGQYFSSKWEMGNETHLRFYGFDDEQLTDAQYNYLEDNDFVVTYYFREQ